MNRSLLLLAAAAASIVAVRALPTRADEPVRLLPPPTGQGSTAPGVHSIVVSGGCFWGIQGVFEHVRGVTRAVAGYTGGPADKADYEDVSTGTTGHAESVRITYDPHRISTARLLQIFFSVALDPTERDRQGPDDGPQYRSEIWTNDPADAKLARTYIAMLDAKHLYASPIATRVDPLNGFYPAETHHQDFLARNPDYPYIAINDIPKVEALKSLFPADYSPSPVLALPSS
jgi:peptide-methionine (S)-S-oxide reductase